MSRLPSGQEGFLGTPISDQVFASYYQDIAFGNLSSDGELTAIANREVARLKKVPSLFSSQSSDDVVKTEPEEAILEAIKPAQSPSEPPTPPPCQSLATKDWAGPHNFTISVPHNQGISKTKPSLKDPQFSPNLNKLYINQNREVPIHVTVDTSDTDGSTATDWLVRATMVYTSSDHCKEPVRVCYMHSHNSSGLLKTQLAPYILRLSCEGSESEVKYLQAPTGHMSALLDPLPPPQPGIPHTTVSLRFTDLGSCAGGINRRDTAVVFTLEKEGVLLGRRVLPVRICTCPGRDKEHDERQAGVTVAKKRKLELTDSGSYWVLATDKDNYEALCAVGRVLEKQKSGNVASWEQKVKKMNSAVKGE